MREIRGDYTRFLARVASTEPRTASLAGQAEDPSCSAPLALRRRAR